MAYSSKLKSEQTDGFFEAILSLHNQRNSSNSSKTWSSKTT